MLETGVGNEKQAGLRKQLLKDVHTDARHHQEAAQSNLDGVLVHLHCSLCWTHLHIKVEYTVDAFNECSLRHVQDKWREWVCMCLLLCLGFRSADVEPVGEKTMDQPTGLRGAQENVACKL